MTLPLPRRNSIQAACLSLLAMALGLGTATSAQAQGDYPNRTIKLVLPYPAGGGSDAMARTIADKLQQVLGQTVVVENRPGASGTIGNYHVIKSLADGYTLLYSNTSLIQQPWMMSKLPYDPLKDLTPVIVVSRITNALVVPRKHSTVTNFKEFVALAKANPGKFSAGSWGLGGGAHLLIETLNQQAHIDLLHVPFQGSSPLAVNLLGGQVQSGAVDAPTLITYSEAFRPLAVAGPQRLPRFPDVPTFQELGYENMSFDGWHGLLLPPKTPAAIVQKLSAAMNTILRMPDVVAKIDAMGMLPGGGTPEEYAKSMREDSAIYARIIKAANIRLD
jgi:tripartite-type tricarboxylate transporter receptor subunit TctC